MKTRHIILLSFAVLIFAFGGWIIYSYFKTVSDLGDFIADSMNLPVEVDAGNAQQHEFGIDPSNYFVCYDEVKRNENLSEILTGFGVSMADVNRIAESAEPVFDVRKLRTGRPYCMMQKKDSTQSPAFFIYEKDRVNYVVFDLSDSLDIYLGKRPVQYVQRTASGTINHSLFQTMVDEDLSFDLAIRMSEIYSWSIDFYRLQKGDQFKVVYEEKYVDGEYVGLADIEACQFRHFGEDFNAFRYLQDTVFDFFDENANSLRKAFLKAPLKYSRISSGYSTRRFHPILKRYTSHLGIDYAAPYGTPIYAVGDGVVIEARYKGGNGNYVKIRHNGTYSTQYLHMSRFGEGIRSGTAVKQGQVIGYVGSTGLSTGPHVCYRFWKNGAQVNPFKEEIPPAEPIRVECLDEYNKEMEKLRKRLDAIPISTTSGA